MADYVSSIGTPGETTDGVQYTLATQYGIVPCEAENCVQNRNVLRDGIQILPFSKRSLKHGFSYFVQCAAFAARLWVQLLTRCCSD